MMNYQNSIKTIPVSIIAFFSTLKNNYSITAILLLFIIGFFPITSWVIGNSTLEVITRCGIIIIWLFFTYLRFLNNQYRINFDKDEIIINIFCLVTAASTFFFSINTLYDLLFPFAFFASFIGINSYFKTSISSRDLITTCLHAAVILAFGHIIIMSIQSSEILWAIMTFTDTSATGINRANLMTGILDTSNTFALQMFIGHMASMSLFYRSIENGKKGIVFAASAFIFLSMILFSVSRGALFATLIFNCIILLQALKNNVLKLKQIKPLLPLLILLASLFAALVIKYDLFDNMISKFSQGTTYRAETWYNFLIMKKSEFLSLDFFKGYGYRGFQDIVQSLSHGTNMKQIHNFFLETWGRFGFFSMIILVVFLARKLYFNLTQRSSVWYITAIPIAMLSREMFEIVLFIGIFRWEMFFFWIMLLAPFYINDRSHE